MAAEIRSLSPSEWVTGSRRYGLSLGSLTSLNFPSSFPPPQPPSEEKINGILLGFRLRYRELLYDRLRGYSAHAISSISAWADLTGEADFPAAFAPVAP